MDDVRAVMDAAGSRRAALLGVSEGGPMCSLFAATYPARTIALMMIGSYARRLWAPEYPWGPTEVQRETFYRDIERHWGGPLGIEERAPSRAADPAFRDWWAHYLRQGASPGAALALTRMNAEVDVREVLAQIRVPTIVLHRTGDRCLRVEEGRYLASRIPGARFVELPGEDHLPFVGDQEAVLSEIERFLGSFRDTEEEEGTLSTVLCVPTGGADRGSLVVASVLAAVASRFRGQPVTMSGVCLITFDGPARAIRAGLEAAAMLQTSGVPTGVGLHTGECMRQKNRATGVAVEVALAIADRAAPGELLISRTVMDLVAGAGFDFRERGRHTMPAQAGEWRLYSVQGTGSDRGALPAPA